MHNPMPHPWWDDEDVYFAEQANEPLPTGYCGCYCSRKATQELEEEDNEAV